MIWHDGHDMLWIAMMWLKKEKHHIALYHWPLRYVCCPPGFSTSLTCGPHWLGVYTSIFQKLSWDKWWKIPSDLGFSQSFFSHMKSGRPRSPSLNPSQKKGIIYIYISIYQSTHVKTDVKYIKGTHVQHRLASEDWVPHSIDENHHVPYHLMIAPLPFGE